MAVHIEFTIKYSKAVIPAKAGHVVTRSEASALSRKIRWMPDQVRHDKVRVLFCRVINFGERKVEITSSAPAVLAPVAAGALAPRERNVKDFDEDLQDES
ncbi:MAG: hypothetical protein ISS67_02480 [Desulfobacterales bacterium]|uniref:Uncharacterized protein n=1 Tax=Candidatus Desulfaltia bathyphila TaxID=2841697 RepID=A0A8J6TAG5_9BACT|nr:hypothetical protein [Candidatus Desulfaltia bathyphila]MBL7196110.1 hypothetical protein [Desulfobacterales bacterium]MBL7207379.1 hypothetical protein [Desulfobacterales bacterium]